ncbi:MAG: AraC family transcriptional regulator [Defluviitaleaceae bacterium]|nr:AraC family transcriptional regulator [Defluviitaleaceae bacterium]
MDIFSYNLDIKPDSLWYYVDTTAEAKANFVYLHELGHFKAGEKYFTIRQGLDSFLIKMTLSGGGILEYNGQTQKIGAGQFFWIDCANWQHYRTDPEIGHWDVVWVHFSGPTAAAYYEAYKEMFDGATIGKLPLDSPMGMLMDMLLNRFPLSEKKSFFEADILNSGVLTQLMIACISAAQSSTEAVHIPPVVQEIRSYLNINYDQRITLDGLAHEFNLDSHYLQKLFKRYINQSPATYVIHLRMAQAKTLLRTTSQPVSEIASRVGMDNVSHFTRTFKKLEGLTPVQYRKFWNVV